MSLAFRANISFIMVPNTVQRKNLRRTFFINVILETERKPDNLNERFLKLAFRIDALLTVAL